MDDKQRRRYERVARSRDHISANGDIFPAGSKGAQAFERLKAAIKKVEDLDASRETGARNAKQATLIKRDAHDRLLQSVTAIARTAQTIALDDPSFNGKFKAPRKNVNDQELLAIARSFASNALPFKDKFIEYDLPTDFLDTLDATIEDFENAVSQQNEGAAIRKGAGASVDDALTLAEQELERCDTALRNKVTDPAQLEAWDSARRLERAPQKKKTEQPTTKK